MIAATIAEVRANDHIQFLDAKGACSRVLRVRPHRAGIEVLLSTSANESTYRICGANVRVMRTIRPGES